MRFSIPWTVDAAFGDEPLPLIELVFAVSGKYVAASFLIDSGADVSLAPARLGKDIGLDVKSGMPLEISGISPREECSIHGYILPVEVLVLEAKSRVTIPICCADEDVQMLLGRSVFFDIFRIQFDQKILQSNFET